MMSLLQKVRHDFAIFCIRWVLLFSSAVGLFGVLGLWIFGMSVLSNLLEISPGSQADIVLFIVSLALGFQLVFKVLGKAEMNETAENVLSYISAFIAYLRKREAA